MSEEELEKNLTEDEYIEYWVNKGVSQANHTVEHRQLSKQKEEKFNMIVEMTVPWQRNLVMQLIDDIKSIENENVKDLVEKIKLIYDNEHRLNKVW